MKIVHPNLNNRRRKNKWLRIILIILGAIAVAALFSSCSTLHKIKTLQHIAVDSSGSKQASTVDIHKIDSSVVTRATDSSASKSELNSVTETTTGYDLINVDSGAVISFQPTEKTDPADYFPPVVITKPNGQKQILVPRKQETKTERKSTEENKKSTSETESKTQRGDSSASKSAEQASKHTDLSIKDKTVTRASHAWIYWGGGGLLLLLLIVIVIRYRKKIFPWLRIT